MTPTQKSTPAPALVATVLLTAAASPGSAAIYYVGFGCELTSVEAAVALAAGTTAADEIRIVNTATLALSGGLHFTNWGPGGHGALTLSGGWSSCTDTVPSAPRSGISWGGATPVVEIDTTGSNTSHVVLQRLEVGGSNARGIVAEGNSTVDLLDVLVFFNSGGGVSVESGASVYLDADSAVATNGLVPIAQGGGIRCVDAPSEVILDAFVGGNAATEGGGVYVGNGCFVTLEPNTRIYDNDATVGGGLYATTGAQVLQLNYGAVIDRNHAASSGGGLAANGAGTSVYLAGGNINLNTAGFAGAGVYVNGSAVVTLDADLSCAALPVCPSFLAFNDLTAGAHDGAAAVVYNDGDLRLFQTLVEHNDVPEPEPFGSVLHAEGAGSLIRTESTTVSGNLGANAVFKGLSGASIQVAFTTAAFNFYESGVVHEHAQGVHIEGTGTTGRLNTSIFHPVGGYHVGSGASFSQIDCLITETTAGLPGGSYVVVADPLYTDVVTGDLRPRINSPAVDFCDALVLSPTQSDLDGRTRGHDVPGNLNGLPGVPGGTQDAGAYEVRGLFADGFESGNTALWSAVTP